MLSILILNGFLGALLTVYWSQYRQLLASITITCSWLLFFLITQGMNFSVATVQFIETYTWMPSLSIGFSLGIDTLSWLFVLLTLFIMSLVIVAICIQEKEDSHQYLGIMLLLMSMMLGVFLAQDAILFYLFWEGVLIPMFLCINIWGSDQKYYAAMKFFLFTFIGSILMLVALIYMGIKADSFAIKDLIALSLNFKEQTTLFILLVSGFAVKIPMVPIHTWLPSVHTEASTEGSVVLAALMLKLGGYGLIRWLLPLVPDAARYFSPWMVVLSLMAIVYIGIVTYGQTDMKKLIAYASISHMGFVTLGLFLIYDAPTIDIAMMSCLGAVIQMISHAFSSGGLFLSFGWLYETVKQREIALFQGLFTQMPWYSVFFILFVLSTIGVPATAGFVGEWAVITAAIITNPIVGLMAMLGVLLSACYMLNMVKTVFFGQPSLSVVILSDISIIQIILLLCFATAIIGIGLYPAVITNILMPSLTLSIKLALASKLGGV